MVAFITGISPAIFFLVVFLIIIAAASIKTLREYERGVIFRLGRLIGAKGPGLIFIILRFLQTLTEVSAENNSTVIVPIPIDLLAAFFQKKEKV